MAQAPVSAGGIFAPAPRTGPPVDADAHADAAFRVTGRMAPTGSPCDRAILVPVEAVWQVHGPANGAAPGTGHPDDETQGDGAPAEPAEPVGHVLSA